MTGKVKAAGTSKRFEDYPRLLQFFAEHEDNLSSKGPLVFGHIGNLGYDFEREGIAPKTEGYSKKHDNVIYVGIDALSIGALHTRKLANEDRDKERLEEKLGVSLGRASFAPAKNWLQINGEFTRVLRSLPDDTFDLLSSEMAVGGYAGTGGQTSISDRIRAEGEGPYTTEILRLCLLKLKPGRKMTIVTSKAHEDMVKDSFADAGFPKDGTASRPLNEKEYGLTYWTSKGSPDEKKLVRITARKPKEE